MIGIVSYKEKIVAWIIEFEELQLERRARLNVARRATSPRGAFSAIDEATASSSSNIAGTTNPEGPAGSLNASCLTVIDASNLLALFLALFETLRLSGRYVSPRLHRQLQTQKMSHQPCSPRDRQDQ